MNIKVKKSLLWLLDLGLNVGIIFGLVIVIQTWIIAPFDVSGASMCDTINFINDKCENGYGEKIIINEAGYVWGEPERGDIVVFKVKNDTMANKDVEEKFFIKRVIGLPGETVEIKNGYVYVKKVGAENAVKLEEPYLNEINRGNTKPHYGELTVFHVPEDQYFVLGDNRRASTDSRSCFQSPLNDYCPNNPEEAFVKDKEIRGKTWIIWWPLSNIRIAKKTTYPEFDEKKVQRISESLEEK